MTDGDAVTFWLAKKEVFTQYYFLSDSMNKGKNIQLGFGLLHKHIVKIRASCFDTDFASQMKLTTIP